ncbi:MAG TPA: class I SAM-dependent methyltransferase [Polyangiaceae bacterium]|jgi:ubiquinone/menaquinone biosynthesis C-methylase UbiE|nr:class I SAM-dependent methyltransferase [Polyangiaceae bacterium]
MPFDADRLAAIARMEPDHFWFAGRRALLDTMLEPLLAEGDPLLEVGCGTGSLVRRFSARGVRMVGLDARPEGLDRARADLGAAGAPGTEFVLGDVHDLPFAARSFAGALALDVLEHVDDTRALAELARVLRPRGWLFVTVPALPFLWSRRDELAGHLRRYTRRSLGHALEDAGFRVECLRFYQFALLPFVAVSRRFGRASAVTRDFEDRPSAWLNRAFKAVNLAEVRSGVTWPAGSSLFAIARKTA